MTHEEVEERAEQVLRKTDTHREPVPIEVLALRLRLTTQAAALGQSVSGILVAADETWGHRLQFHTYSCSTTIYHRS